MNDKEMLSEAYYYSHTIHNGQTDKNNEDYFTGHVMRIVEKCKTKKEKIVAYLHDIIEDSKGLFTINELKFDFSDEIVSAVDAITRRKKENYFDYIQRIKQNQLATKVKIIDLEDNSNEERLSKLDHKQAISLKKRYEKAKQILTQT
jgi:(p)ppGpp synthase/HD superfamily hydrolase